MNCFSFIIGYSNKYLRTLLLFACLVPNLPVIAGNTVPIPNEHFLAAPPNWVIDPLDFEYNMNLVIRVQFEGVNSNNPSNIVGAFVGNELRGVATPVIIAGEAFFFATVYSNNYVGETVNFRVYYAPDDLVYATPATANFLHNSSIGTTINPFILNIDPNADYPPELLPILADTTLQGIPFDPVNLVDYLVSVDGDPVTWTALAGINLTASIVNGVLTVTPISGMWTGTDTVRITVTENTANMFSDAVTAYFTVLPDYGPPVWLVIPDQTIFQGDAFAPFDLDDYLVFGGDCHQFDYDVFPFTGSDADPAWPVVDPGMLPMSVVARPLFADEQLAGAGAKLAAFVNGVLSGWASPVGVSPNVSYSLLLKNVGPGNITFQFYDADNQYLYEKSTSLAYTAGGSVGSIAAPYELQLSPLLPILTVNGAVDIEILDTSWLGTYPVDFIVWDCLLPSLRRDTAHVLFSIVTDGRPQITSGNAVNYEENACGTLYDAQTSDPNDSEGAGLTYSLAGGADALKFSIDPQTGILSWAIGFSPDFESPADADMNNQYLVNIQVTNTSNLSDTLALTVTITDQVTEPFMASINGGVSVICATGNVNLQAANGTGFLWNTGATASLIVVNSAGTYTVTVTSSGTCTATASVLVAAPPSITAAGNSGPVCIGSEILLSSTPSGGTLPYAAFSWAGPNGYSANIEDPAGFPATAAAAGTYTVTVTDDATCTATATKTITVSANGAPSITASSNSPLCVGASLQLSSMASGGSGMYSQYSWAGPNNYTAAVQNPAAFPATLAAAGTYTVTVTDNAGCKGTGSTSVTVNPTPTITASSNTPICVGATVLLMSTPAGGSGFYTVFQWAGPNNYSANVEDPAGFPATPATSGTYTVTVTDNAGCTATKTTSVSVSGLPSITAALLAPVCTGGMVALGSTPTGGSGIYSGFQWSGPNNYSATVEDPAPFPVTPLVAGVYSVTVTDQTGCTATSSLTVSVSSVPAITASNSSPLCLGFDLSLFSTPSGGSGIYPGFMWTGPDNYVASTEDPVPFSTTLASAGVYQVKVTDSNGCTATTTTTVVVNANPTSTASSNGPLCLGSTLKLYAAPAGGAGGYSFNWTGPSSFSSILEAPSRSPVLLVYAGTYRVTVTDAIGCSKTSSTSVSVTNAVGPSISATSSSPVCSGHNLTLSSTPSGGTIPYTAFSWAGPNNYAAAQEDPAPFQVFVSGAGTYTVTVTDSKNCNSTATVSVIVNGPSVLPSSNSPVCPNANILLNAGGTGVTYAWTGPNGYSSNLANPPGFPATPPTAGVYTVSVTDSNGCTNTGSVTVSVGDPIPPVITCPANKTVSADANCSGTVGSHAPLSVSDNCNPNPTVTQSPAPATGLQGHNDVKTVTLTADDGNGNTASCMFTVTLKDVTAPAITCPANMTVAADANCSGSVGAYAPVSVSDNCAANPSVTQSPSASTVLSGHNDSKVVTLTANDGNGNTNFCTLTVTLKDISPPTITCPANMTIAADANCSGVVGAYSPVSVADNCNPNPTVTQSPDPATVLSGHNDSEIVTLTADDGNGNMASCTLTVTLKDVTAPSITCPANMTVAADANCSGEVGPHTPVSVSDNCTANPTVTQNPAPSTALNGHNDVETVTLTADDGNGNTASCSFTVTLKDVTPPSITCPANMTVEADANCSGVVGSHDPVSVSDNCNPNPTVTQSPDPATVLSGHNDSEIVTLTADDGNGNTNFCTFTVTLKDVTPPTITCPADMTIAADANCSGVVGAYSPVSVADNCNPNPTVTQSPDASTVLSGHNDSELVTLTADDGNGNSAFCTLTVTLLDLTPPTITCPADVTIAADVTCSGVVGAHAPATLSDNCTANPLVTQSPDALTVLSGHNDSEIVTLTADDGNGNTAFCTLTVTLLDVTPPSITCPADVTLAADGTCSGVVGAYSPTTLSDNCTANPAVTQSPAPTTVLSGHNDSELVTLTADDGNGNTAFCTFTVTLLDVTPPTITCPADVTIAADANCSGVVGAYSPVSVADNCNANPTVTQSPVSTTVLSGHNDSELVTLTADDGNGNDASCSFTVTLLDITPPTVVCKPDTVALDANGTASITTADVFESGADNCGTVNQESVVANSFTCANLGDNIVVLTVNDGNGNTATCNATVTVLDTTPPTMICMNATLNLNNAGNATLTVANINNGSFDNCTLSTLVLSQTAFTCANLGSNTVTLTGTDQSGNSAQCTATVTVLDLIPPVALCKNATVNLDATGNIIVAPAVINNGSSDNCSFTLSVTPNAFTCADLGNHVVTLKATDSSNNMSTCNATVTVKDITPPTALCSNLTIFLNTNGLASLTALQASVNSTDNCSIVNRTISQISFNCSDIGGPVNVFVSLTDQSGNVSNCTAVITVKDTLPPTAICINVTVTLVNGFAIVHGSQLASQSFDNCAVWSYTPASKVYTIANLGINYLDITVKDFSGNGAVCTSEVTVLMNGPSERPDPVQQDTLGNNSKPALKMKAYPNPSAGDVVVEFELTSAQTFILQVVDIAGQVTHRQEEMGFAGKNSLLLRRELFLPGIYILDLRSKGTRANKPLIIRE